MTHCETVCICEHMCIYVYMCVFFLFPKTLSFALGTRMESREREGEGQEGNGEERILNRQLSVKNNSLKKNSMNSFEEKVRVVNRMIKTIQMFLTGEDKLC